jgi:hypothetical protein
MHPNESETGSFYEGDSTMTQLEKVRNIEKETPAKITELIAMPMGPGEIGQPRRYQLIRQKGRTRDRLFEIEFLGPGAQAFSFTFG